MQHIIHNVKLNLTSVYLLFKSKERKIPGCLLDIEKLNLITSSGDYQICYSLFKKISKMVVQNAYQSPRLSQTIVNCKMYWTVYCSWQLTSAQLSWDGVRSEKRMEDGLSLFSSVFCQYIFCSSILSSIFFISRIPDLLKIIHWINLTVFQIYMICSVVIIYSSFYAVFRSFRKIGQTR